MNINFYKLLFLHKLNGHSNAEIAAAYDLSPRTVEAYLEKLRFEYNAKNLTHLAGLMIHAGAITKESFPIETLEALQVDREIVNHVVFDGESITGIKK